MDGHWLKRVGKVGRDYPVDFEQLVIEVVLQKGNLVLVLLVD